VTGVGVAGVVEVVVVVVVEVLVLRTGVVEVVAEVTEVVDDKVVEVAMEIGGVVEVVDVLLEQPMASAVDINTNESKSETVLIFIILNYSLVDVELLQNQG
jgi:hypothetical protein